MEPNKRSYKERARRYAEPNEQKEPVEMPDVPEEVRELIDDHDRAMQDRDPRRVQDG